MTYKKEEITVNGHEVTVQQVRGPDSSMGPSEPSAWIDGKAAHTKYVVSEDSPSYEKVKETATKMAKNDQLFCKKCRRLYPIQNSVNTGFAGHKCGECADKDSTCKDGGAHKFECLNPNQKHNARVPTKYKCTKCGKKKKTTPTG